MVINSKIKDIMKNVKRIKQVLLIIAMVFSIGSLSAQQGGGKQHGHQGPPPIPNEEQIEEMVSNMATEISLRSQQEKEILLLYKEHFAEVEKRRADKHKCREEMNAYRDAFHKEVKEVLSAEQAALYDKYVETQKQQRGLNQETR
jgi:hypothetical protein